MLKALALLWLALPLIADASTLYRCSDEFGHTTYTNYKSAKKCTVLSRDDSPSRDSAKSSNASGAVNPPSTPIDFPKVAKETQKNRDGDRRFILEQEVETEKKNLDEARKSLSDLLAASPAATSPERSQPARDRIALHERNLDALRREISNLK